MREAKQKVFSNFTFPHFQNSGDRENFYLNMRNGKKAERFLYFTFLHSENSGGGENFYLNMRNRIK